MLSLFPHKENNARENQALPPPPLTPSGLLGGVEKGAENQEKALKNKGLQDIGRVPILADFCLFMHKCFPKNVPMFPRACWVGKQTPKIKHYDYNFDML